MKHLRKYNESDRPIYDNVTEEEKEYFDLVFADYIDEGATSNLTLARIQNSHTMRHISTNRYVINIDLNKLVKRKDYLGRATLAPMGNLDQLVNYTNEINELVLDIQTCFNKIKSEYPTIKSFISNSMQVQSTLKIDLILYF
jgi:hypothetical protein